ncbi:hypothetical protein QTO30_17800 [Yoonia sp. GPGPB17]|uniref:hypothetical protein n=1 Tax=Yoonia sp. GPGPB17 TaxID=3026147 RepID=UPI0030BEA88C
MNLRSTLILILAYAMAVPVVAQSVDPKSIAAIKTTAADWDVADQMAEDVGPLTADVVMWLRLRAGEADFAEYQDFLTRRADWPGLGRVRAQGELLIEDRVTPEAILTWFGDETPQTGQGAVRLARAQLTLGQDDAARETLRDTWINHATG